MLSQLLEAFGKNPFQVIFGLIILLSAILVIAGAAIGICVIWKKLWSKL